jgi:hypothetical protein
MTTSFVNFCNADPCSTEFDGYDEDETVRVIMTGNQEPKAVDITQAAMDAGAEVGTIHAVPTAWIFFF